jgi:hypothetical protein
MVGVGLVDVRFLAYDGMAGDAGCGGVGLVGLDAAGKGYAE